MSAPTILVTGFPGFIGTRLVARLLADDTDSRIVVLVEPRMAGRAQEVAVRLAGGRRIEVVTGDIGERRLGLTDARHARLAGEVTKVFHLAAIYDLAVPAAIAERVNVRGTENVVGFCRACANLERLDYVSTAYTAGERSGRVMEGDLAEGQAFKNHYESTKFAAEIIVRGAMGEVPTAIWRPAIVVGDSQTGETQKFDGPYYLLRLIALCARLHLPIPRIGRGDAPFNVVPVDFVVDALAVGSRIPQTLGRTFHLTDADPLSADELLAVLAREYAGRAPRLRVSPALLERSLRHSPVRKLLAGTPRESLVYMNHPVQFDTTNTREVLGAAGLACPGFEDYSPAITRFFEQHEHDAAFAPAR